MSNLMEKDVYNAAVNGDLTIFRNKNHEQLLKKTNQNNNIIHIAAQHQQLDFIKAALNSFPSTPTCESLICDQNRHGNTSLHIAAQVRYEPLIVQLYEFYSTQCNGSDRVLPWRMVNTDGNTPAHVALIYSNASVAMYLIDKDDYVARTQNHSKETLLHLAIQYHNFDNEAQIPQTQAVSSSKKVYQPGEELRPIIRLLLKRESSVACWTDTDGLTPLHRATSLHPAYCIPVIKAMLASCPEAAEVQDERTDHTVLHLLTNHQVASYEQGLELLQMPQVYALRNIKDHQGDTPLHLAARNNDSIMVRVLLSSSPHLDMKNKCGVSAGSLVQQVEEVRITENPIQHKRKLTKEECEAANEGNVAFLKEQLASLEMNFLVSQTHKGGNILHILLQYEFNKDSIIEAEEFMGAAIQKLPLLISQQDCNDDTPIHVLADNIYSLELLEFAHKYYEKAQEEVRGDARVGLYLPPWRMKNIKGDSPLHVAVRAGQYAAAIKLLEFDEELAGYINNRNETPLHLLSHHKGYNATEMFEDLISCLIKRNPDLPYMQDEDGLTPLLTAIRDRCIPLIQTLLRKVPGCWKIADFKGRTFWHLFVQGRQGQKSTSFEDFNLVYKEFGNQPDRYEVRCLMARHDKDGNTPLHLAIANRHFDFAQFFVHTALVSQGRGDDSSAQAYLKAVNNNNVSCYDLIGSAEHLPREFEKSIAKEENLLFGYRSMYGVPTTKIEEYANTIGVIAALLATITFTTAFTVPGGLDNNNGTPLLLQKVAFQVFMVANVVAMCLSMMVLFCLLWIMTTGNKKETILLLDISVFLLQTSFHATLVTFMMGLYVTTVSIVPAIAISTCVTCTLLIILMHKKLVMWIVVPLFGLLITFTRAIRRPFVCCERVSTETAEDWFRYN